MDMGVLHSPRIFHGILLYIDSNQSFMEQTYENQMETITYQHSNSCSYRSVGWIIDKEWGHYFRDAEQTGICSPGMALSSSLDDPLYFNGNFFLSHSEQGGGTGRCPRRYAGILLAIIIQLCLAVFVFYISDISIGFYLARHPLVYDPSDNIEILEDQPAGCAPFASLFIMDDVCRIP